MTETSDFDVPDDLKIAIDRSHLALKALAAGDAEPCRDIYASVDYATLFGTYGGHDVGWRALSRRLDAIAPLVAETASGGEVTIETLSAVARGDLAYTVELEVQHAPTPDGADEGEAEVIRTLRVTQVFERVAGTWKLVHRHADPLADVQPALRETGWGMPSS